MGDRIVTRVLGDVIRDPRDKNAVAALVNYVAHVRIFAWQILNVYAVGYVQYLLANPHLQPRHIIAQGTVYDALALARGRGNQADANVRNAFTDLMQSPNVSA